MARLQVRKQKKSASFSKHRATPKTVRKAAPKRVVKRKATPKKPMPRVAAKKKVAPKKSPYQKLMSDYRASVTKFKESHKKIQQGFKKFGELFTKPNKSFEHCYKLDPQYQKKIDQAGKSKGGQPFKTRAQGILKDLTKEFKKCSPFETKFRGECKKQVTALKNECAKASKQLKDLKDKWKKARKAMKSPTDSPLAWKQEAQIKIYSEAHRQFEKQVKWSCQIK